MDLIEAIPEFSRDLALDPLGRTSVKDQLKPKWKGAQPEYDKLCSAPRRSRTSAPGLGNPRSIH